MYEVVLAGFVIALVAYMIRPKTTQKDIKLPPGPEPSFFFGNVKDLDTTKIHHSLHRLAQQFGPVVHIRLLSRNIVILNTADIIREAYDTEKYRVSLNDKPKGFFGTYLVYNHSDVLLGPYSKTTFRLKEIMLQGLKPSLSATAISQEAKNLVQRLDARVGKDFCIKNEIQRSMAEVTTMLLLGECTDGDVDMMWEFVDWSNKLLNPSVESVLKNLPFLRFLPGRYGFLYRTAKEKRDHLLRRFFDEYRTTYKAGIHRGLVDTCLQMQETEEKLNGHSWLTDDMIRAVILDTIGAGLVSTTNTILATVLNLVHNKECLKKMQREIDTVLGRNRHAVPEDMGHLDYCCALIYETQRFSSIVPIVSHYCSTEDVEFEGYTLPKGTMVWGNIWSAHHDNKDWTDPWTFRPERFLDSQGKLMPESSPSRARLIPLGVGPRYCVGKSFAMTRLFSYITSIVQHFDILPPKDGELSSNDPLLYTSGAVLELKDFTLRLENRHAA